MDTTGSQVPGISITEPSPSTFIAVPAQSGVRGPGKFKLLS